MATELLVGAPVKNREFVLEHYLVAATEAALRTGMKTKFLFVLDLRSEGDLSIIEDFFNSPEQVIAGLSYRVIFIEDQTLEYKRDWHVKGRYDHMVYIRNELLNGVREEAPDFFLSLDTDMIIHPELINNFMENIHRFDGIGGKAYMTPTRRQFPSYGIFNRRGNMQRAEHCGVIGVDVIMAIKFMTPNAYNIDYYHDKMGEDIGWSRSATESGFKLGWDGRITNKHVMNEGMLEVDDPRVEWLTWNGEGYEISRVPSSSE